MTIGKLSAKASWALIALLGALLVAVIGVGAYAAYFADRALPRTTVAGQSVSGQNRDEIAQGLQERASHASINVTVDGTLTSATLEEAGIAIDTDATLDDVFAPNGSILSRISSLFTSRDVQVVTSRDDAAAQALTQKVSASVDQPVREGSIQFNEDGGAFSVIEAQEGHSVDLEQLASACDEAARTLTTQDIDLPMIAVSPTVTTQIAQQLADKANTMLEIPVSITDGIHTYSPDARERSTWIALPDLNAAGGAGGKGAAANTGALDVTWNEKPVRAWVESTALSTNEEPTKGVKNVNSRGDVVAVADPGKSGWTVNNAGEVADELLAALKDGTAYEGDFDYDQTEPEFTTREIADGAGDKVYQAAPGEKWIDVDLSNASVTAYEGATVVQGPIPMVPGKPGWETVTGTFRIYLKHQDQMMGCSPGYDYCTYTPWESYFHGDYALHGAPSRSSFGWSGEGGSHGCVNMPVDGAQWIYNWAPVGTVVVSHY